MWIMACCSAKPKPNTYPEPLSSADPKAIQSKLENLKKSMEEDLQSLNSRDDVPCAHMRWCACVRECAVVQNAVCLFLCERVRVRVRARAQHIWPDSVEIHQQIGSLN